jgi:hypothetical protein
MSYDKLGNLTKADSRHIHLYNHDSKFHYQYTRHC